MNLKPVILNFCYSIVLSVTLLAAGCGSMFKNMGSDVVGGASSKMDTLSRNMVRGVIEELSDPRTKKQVAHFADSIITAINNSLNPKIKGMMDTVFNHKILLWTDSLVEVVSGKKLQLNMKNLQYTLVGKTKTDILEIRNSFKDLFEQILSDSTNTKLGKMRDEMLGAKTDSAISKIVDHATQKFMGRFNTDLNPTIKEDVSFISRHGLALLIALGVIAAAIILLVWWRKSRYQKMVTMLTKHINKIPDQQVYDKVTSSIKDEAISTGLEPDLRKILQANGLLNNPNWDSKRNK
jgi:hypothetical protein